jgi:hypothetical protein
MDLDTIRDPKPFAHYVIRSMIVKSYPIMPQITSNIPTRSPYFCDYPRIVYLREGECANVELIRVTVELEICPHILQDVLEGKPSNADFLWRRRREAR